MRSVAKLRFGHHAVAAAGFAALTLVPVTVNHLWYAVSLGEVIDSVISTMFLTVFFTTGLLLAGQARPSRPPPSFWRSLAPGCLAAASMQALIWTFWMSFSHADRSALAERLGEWPLVAHSTLASLAGATVALFANRDIPELRSAE